MCRLRIQFNQNIVYMQEQNNGKSLFSLRLLEAMQSKGLTQKRLGELTNIRQTTISEYANDKSVPSTDKFSKIAIALDVSMEWLWGISDNDVQYQKKEILPESEWERRAKNAEERLDRMELILKELFAFAKIR